MLRLVILALFVALSVSENPEVPKNEDGNLSTKIVVVKSLEEAKLLFPEGQFLPMESMQLARQQIAYTLGGRISGDRVVAQAADSRQWSTPQNIQLRLSYPQSGAGAIVTYVSVIVNQSTNIGGGYVLSGGIGNKQITLLIVAGSTTYFEYAAQIFGK